MPDLGDLSRFQLDSALRDGTPVLIRAVRADDRERVVAAFNELDPQTIYTRYFAFRKSLSEDELGRLGANDFDHYILLVATLGSGADEIVIAGASCVVLDATSPIRAAEVAFTVEEDCQRQGLAGKLLAAIVEIARSRGIGHLEADVLSSNTAMLSVFRRSGLPMTTSQGGGVVHLVLDLGAGVPGAPGAAKA